MRAIAMLLIFTLACHTGRVTVTPGDLARNAHLVRSGTAELAAQEESSPAGWRSTTVTVERETTVEVQLADRALDANHGNADTKLTRTRIAIGDLLAECPGGAFEDDDTTRRAHPRCVLFAVHERHITVGQRRFSKVGPKTVIALGVIGGLGVCAFKCDSPWSTISAGTLIVSGAVLTFGLILAVSFAKGKRQ